MLTKQINLIEDKNIRKDVEFIMSQIPDYFYKVAASSTGKYHPEFSLGEGGLLRHTKAAVRIAVELFELEEFAQYEKDKIRQFVASYYLSSNCYFLPLFNNIKKMKMHQIIKKEEVQKLTYNITKNIKGNIYFV